MCFFLSLLSDIKSFLFVFEKLPELIRDLCDLMWEVFNCMCKCTHVLKVIAVYCRICN